jgi:hypothetical protein
MKKLLWIAALGCLVYGIYSGGIETVLQKATFICLECVGIG